MKKICWFLIFVIFLNSGCSKRPDDSDANSITLYSIYGAKVRAMDPGDIGDTTSSIVASQIFDTLYCYHYLKRPYELIPSLAANMPKVSPDGLTYTIKIKQGVYFADDVCFDNGVGRELVADDFIFAWKRIADIKYRSKNWWIFDGKILGLDEFREYSKTCKSSADVNYNRPIEGLFAKDRHTLVIKLKKPWPQIIYLLAHLPTAPISKEAVGYYGKNIINHPVGTGAYKLKVWNRGSSIEFIKNETFRDEYYPNSGQADDAEGGLLDDAGRKLPLADRTLMVLVQESTPAWFLFMQGKIDASGIPKDNFSEAIDQSRQLTEGMKERNISLKVFRNPSTYWYGFNMEDEIIGSNKPLRQAISCSVDREKYIELFTNNRGEPAYGFVPPMMKSYNPEIKDFAKTEYNPQRARELLAEAEKLYGGKLPKITLSMAGTDVLFRQMGDFLKKGFDQAGLNIDIDYMDWPTFQNKVKTKSLQIFSLGWVADYPDAENFLQLFYSKNASPGPNNFNYYNPEFDRLYERVSVMQESDERVELYRQAEKIVVDDCPAVFLTHGVAFVLNHDWLLNAKPHAFGYGLSKYRGIDKNKRDSYKKLLKELK